MEFLKAMINAISTFLKTKDGIRLCICVYVWVDENHIPDISLVEYRKVLFDIKMHIFKFRARLCKVQRITDKMLSS